MTFRAVRGSIRGLIPVISGFPFVRGFWVREREKVMKSSRVLGIGIEKRVYEIDEGFFELRTKSVVVSGQEKDRKRERLRDG